MPNITPQDVKDHIAKLGLRSCAIHGASYVEASLSQPRGVLVLIREKSVWEDDLETAALCETGIETLTELIGDNFKPKPIAEIVAEQGKN